MLFFFQNNITVNEWKKGECQNSDEIGQKAIDDNSDHTSPDDCPKIGCSKVIRPVCASNGVSYSSECILRQIACEYGLDLTVVREGRCEDDGEKK